MSLWSIPRAPAGSLLRCERNGCDNIPRGSRTAGFAISPGGAGTGRTQGQPEGLCMSAILPEKDSSNRGAPELFERLFELSPDAIVVTDRQGRIASANAQVERIFGYSRTELLGKPVEVLMPERFRQVHPSHRGKFAAQPQVRPMGIGLELFGRRKDGSEFPVDIMLSPVESGEASLVLCVVRDVSE